MRARRWWCCLALATACGRLGFETTGSGGAAGDDAPTGDGQPPGDTTGDAAMMIGCADVNLGSVLGPNVANGSTAGKGNDFSACSGDGNEVTFGWFAPATGSFRIDLCASQATWDSVLYVRNGSCTGSQLACDDDSCGGLPQLQGRVTVSLVAGQGVVILVDGLFPVDGNYQLGITQL